MPRGVIGAKAPLGGAVYVVAEAGTNLVKIGRVDLRTFDLPDVRTCVGRRLAGLQIGNPRRLYVACWLVVLDGLATPETPDVEVAAHEAFLATYARGEWFYRSPHIDEFIARVHANESLEQIMAFLWACRRNRADAESEQSRRGYQRFYELLYGKTKVQTHGVL